MILPYSVIIPVFQEATFIEDTLRHVLEVAAGAAVEIIVVDGDLAGGTIREIRDTWNNRVQKVLSEKGRGIQLNRGASLARGEILLFLHVDTRLPAEAFHKITAAMEDRQIAGGAFQLAIDSPRLPFRVIEKVVTYRSRYLGLPYGDQGIFLRKSYFDALGGFRDVPIMEDLDLMCRIRRSKGRIVILDDPVLTSARRWEQEGILYGTLRNWCLVLFFLLGVPPEKLLKFYPSSRTASPRAR